MHHALVNTCHPFCEPCVQQTTIYFKTCAATSTAKMVAAHVLTLQFCGASDVRTAPKLRALLSSSAFSRLWRGRCALHHGTVNFMELGVQIAARTSCQRHLVARDKAPHGFDFLKASAGLVQHVLVILNGGAEADTTLARSRRVNRCCNRGHNG
eukprot:m.781513 g.781513  ORF g.781513 m.781513 type:complete len:154 (-) comp23286_c0_seq4:3326-3787(-)